MHNEPHRTWYHDDVQRFRESLTFTEARSGFSARLIEKDYYCTHVLADLCERFERALVFKGGTCLSKVHAEFFRLSEDLDFSIATPSNSTRSDRRRAVADWRGGRCHHASVVGHRRSPRHLSALLCRWPRERTAKCADVPAHRELQLVQRLLPALLGDLEFRL